MSGHMMPDDVREHLQSVLEVYFDRQQGDEFEIYLQAAIADGEQLELTDQERQDIADGVRIEGKRLDEIALRNPQANHLYVDLAILSQWDGQCQRGEV